MTVPCSICAAPYLAISDDPSPAHPSCEPADRNRYEAATSGPRTYRGRMTALLDAGCRGCDRRVAVGDEVVLADVDGTRAWIHVLCAAAPSEPIASPIALDDARESRREALRAGHDEELATRRTA